MSSSSSYVRCLWGLLSLLDRCSFDRSKSLFSQKLNLNLSAATRTLVSPLAFYTYILACSSCTSLPTPNCSLCHAMKLLLYLVYSTPVEFPLKLCSASSYQSFFYCETLDSKEGFLKLITDLFALISLLCIWGLSNMVSLRLCMFILSYYDASHAPASRPTSVLISYMSVCICQRGFPILQSV